jgi:hypothetical protein
MVWTPPCIGAYLFTHNNVDSHNLNSNVDCTLDAGTLITSGARANGYVLTCGASVDGVNSTISYNKQVEGHTYSMYGQIRTNGDTEITRLEQTSTPQESVVMGINASMQPYLWIYAGGGGTTVATCGAIPVNEWYDVVASYDQSTNSGYIYAWPSNNGDDFTHYLSGASVLATYFDANTSVSLEMTTTSFNKIALLRNGAGTTSLLMNAFIFEGCLGSMEFNMLRRACHYWNEQTEVYPK